MCLPSFVFLLYGLGLCGVLRNLIPFALSISFMTLEILSNSCLRRSALLDYFIRIDSLGISCHSTCNIFSYLLSIKSCVSPDNVFLLLLGAECRIALIMQVLGRSARPGRRIVIHHSSFTIGYGQMSSRRRRTRLGRRSVRSKLGTSFWGSRPRLTDARSHRQSE